jgi:tyrosyl-tRNA synthetase
MHVLDLLIQRGFVQQTTDPAALRSALSAGPVTFYVGFDPTGNSLHIGHLLPIMAMAWLQKAGHRPIIVLGGGTAMVGDPSGKDKTRDILTREQIGVNLAGQRVQFSRFLAVEGQAGSGADPSQLGSPAAMVDNGDWLLALNYVDFLRDIGRHFSVNRMLSAESAKQRLERDQGLSFIEFNYHLLQSYDFLVLYRERGCTLQLGGDDQWFNILGGADLVRREHGADAHAMTVPLLTTADGKKMGKTESGAVWLDPAQVLPYDYFQYWLNVADADVGRFLRLYTFLPIDEIAPLDQLEGAASRAAKRVLARAATALAHGEAAAEQADRVSSWLFGDREGADRDEMLGLLRATGAMPMTATAFPTPVLRALVDTGLCSSMGEARRLIQQGGARIWDDKVTAIDAVLTGPAVLWSGKKKAALLVEG